jgi:glycosyltransferase involved in cell wall biosynthesis
MRIAEVAPLWYRIPPKKYGGAEMSVYLLTEGLVKKGHDVTLFASGNSVTSAKLKAVIKKPLSEMGINYWSNTTYTLLNIHQAIKDCQNFDFLHFHLNSERDFSSLILASLVPTKSVFTVRASFGESSPFLGWQDVLRKFSRANFVSLTHKQRRKSPKLRWVANIHNAVDPQFYKFNPKPEDYFVWVGKVQPEKGTHLAIKAAKLAGVKLLLVGPVDEKNPRFCQYWEKKVKPSVDGKQIVYLGESTRRKTQQIVGSAISLLKPIQWEEPFGLVMIEAMSTGTPVVAFKRGSAPEIIKDGETGFIVNNLRGMVAAIKKVGRIDRKKCRQHVLDNFTPQKMVDAYEKLFQSLL